MSLNDFKDQVSFLIFGMTKKEAVTKNICIDCKKPPVFRTLLGHKEYHISGLCGDCFDKITTPVEES